MDPLTPATLAADRAWTTRDWAVVVVLVGVAAAVFGRAASFGFVDYDDPLYVLNPLPLQHGLTLAGLRWAATATIVGNWHPLTALAELLIAAVFGQSAAAFHTVNVLLHLTNVALLYTFLRRTTGRLWPAAIAAALWGWHPLRVESVAWVSELKDVLCGAMWLCCLLAYAGYSRHRTPGRYAAVLTLHVLAVLAKPMAVTLPATLLLMDLWPLSRRPGDAPPVPWWTARVAEKLPLFAISIADAVYALTTQATARKTAPLATYPLSGRVANAMLSYVHYLFDSVVPTRLAVFYPHPLSLAHVPPPGVLPVAAAAALLVAVTVAVCLVGRRHRYLPVGWFWFLGTTVPVIGLIQLGAQARADRYTYVPAIGLTVAAVWMAADLVKRLVANAVAAVTLAAAAAVVLAVVAAGDVGYWRDSRTLFAHAAAVVPDNYVALGNLSTLDAAEGHVADAIDKASRAVEMAVPEAGPHIQLGDALVTRGGRDDLIAASSQFAFAIGVDGRNPLPWDALGHVYYLQAGRHTADGQPASAAERNRLALQCYAKARQLDPDYVVAGDDLANLLANRGRISEALDVWADVVARAPGYAPGQGDYGDALLFVHRPAEAVRAFRAAVADGGREPRWRTKLAYLLATSPTASPADAAEAVAVATAAVKETHETDPDALDKLGIALARTGQYDAATDRATAARGLAVAAGDHDLVERIDRRLKLYADRRPFLEDLSPASRPTTASTTTRATTVP